LNKNVKRYCGLICRHRPGYDCLIASQHAGLVMYYSTTYRYSLVELWALSPGSIVDLCYSYICRCTPVLFVHRLGRSDNYTSAGITGVCLPATSKCPQPPHRGRRAGEIFGGSPLLPAFTPLSFALSVRFEDTINTFYYCKTSNRSHGNAMHFGQK